MTRFKDKGLQKMYVTCRKFGQDTSSTFYIDGRPHRGAGHRVAYWNGRDGKKTSWPRNSLAHAAWAAGQDDRKAFGSAPPSRS